MTRIFIQIDGGAVYSSTKRVLASKADARAYLTEFGVTVDSVPTTRRSFCFDGFSFQLSDPLEDIFDGDETKPDAQLVLDMCAIHTTKHTSSTSPSKPVPAATIASLGTAPRAPTPTPQQMSLALDQPFKGPVVPLKEICQQLAMEPRVARAKLRKKLPENGKQRWQWDAAEAANIRAILAGT